MKILAVVLLAALAAPFASADVPKPDFDRVDHAKPEKYVDVPPNVGDAARIRSLAKGLVQPKAEDTLAAIARWIRRNVRADERAAPAWRTVDEILKAGSYGGCGEHSVLFGSLARAAGIPTVWVKTMDVDWIRDFRAGRPAAKTYRSHVFLEVHVDGRWRLLDPDTGLLYDDFDPKARIYPGNRFAYDRGGDPFELVLSCRWQEWVQQTQEFFGKLDLAQVPWSRPRDLTARWSVFVAGDAPVAPWAEQTAKGLGFQVPKIFSGAFEENLALARGRTLLVTTSGGRPALPQALWADWLPPGAAEWIAKKGDGGKDWIDRRLPDGTRVVLLRVEDEIGLQKAVLEALRA